MSKAKCMLSLDCVHTSTYSQQSERSINPCQKMMISLDGTMSILTYMHCTVPLNHNNFLRNAFTHPSNQDAFKAIVTEAKVQLPNTPSATIKGVWLKPCTVLVSNIIITIL